MLVILEGLDLLLVSIHAPWEGCDSSTVKSISSLREFQFTHPGKGATSDLP